MLEDNSSQLIDANGHDWSARGELAYYKQPDGWSDEAWGQMSWAGFASAMYFGPTSLPDGRWTVESTAKAAAWQSRRRLGVPYIHRINCRSCRTAPPQRPPAFAERFCWVADLEPGVRIHCGSFEAALGTAQRLLRPRCV